MSGASYSAVELAPAGDRVILLDQRRLPGEERYLELAEPNDVARAVSAMVVRGAPAIGIAAAYALALGARRTGITLEALEELGRELARARPTAVNLAWAVELMLGVARASPNDERADRLAHQARAIHRADVAGNRRLGALGAERVQDGATVLTHCNAGALATGGYGTALGVIRAARDAGKRLRVVADETRPWLQGARLTAWELMRDGIEVELVADAAAGSLFAGGSIDLVVIGADRIAANGDVANKIGSYSVACLARLHERPFYVAAPFSTVDLACASGAEIPIEERSPEEVTRLAGVDLAPAGARARNPAFDVTPARLVTAIFTERGVVEPVGAAGLAGLARELSEA
ncbi:MAG: S-methyl-5-thioribose-1-phosphate isomerase [Sorangiineae bacterium]|nr:S-methyl-5-thioribose-1-phosphate isomerase [Polyangiaceae bacterium]MEB2322110.1 S-methyl-5-thioribose-1-phosphate isomerase [Sorangiineae bacterium]